MMVSAPARRQQVTYAKHRGVPKRRACALMSVARSALHYESRLRAKDALEWFRNRVEAKVVVDQWRRHRNQIGPHSSLGNQTPAAFKKLCRSTTKPEAVFQE